MSYTQFSKEELNRENLINDVDFIYDAKQFLYDREDYQSDNAEDSSSHGQTYENF